MTKGLAYALPFTGLLWIMILLWCFGYLWQGWVFWGLAAAWHWAWCR